MSDRFTIQSPHWAPAVFCGFIYNGAGVTAHSKGPSDQQMCACSFEVEWMWTTEGNL